MEVTDADPQNKDKIKSKYVARTPVDLQRIKVEKLMQHPVSWFPKRPLPAEVQQRLSPEAQSLTSKLKTQNVGIQNNFRENAVFLWASFSISGVLMLGNAPSF